MNIGLALKKIRKEKNLSHGTLHERTGLLRGYISDLERGRIKDPRISTLYKLVKALGVSCDYFIEIANDGQGCEVEFTDE